MSPEEQRKQIRALNKEIEDLYSKLGRQETPPIFDPNQLSQAQTYVKGLNQEFRDMNSQLGSLGAMFRANLQELQNTDLVLGMQKASLRSMSASTNELLYLNSQSTLISDKELEKLKKKAALDLQRLENAKALAITEDRKEDAEAIEADIKSAKEYQKVLQRVAAENEEMASQTGVQIFGNLEGLADKLGLGKFKGAFSEASEAAQASAKAGGKGLTTLKAGFKGLASGIAKAFGPLALIAMAVDALKQADKAVGDMAKGMNMTYRDALAMKREMTDVANASGNIFVTSKNLSETLVSVNEALGTSVQLNDELLVQFTEMREMAGFTNEELQSIANLSITTGESMNDVTGEFMAQAKMSALQNGVILNTKTLTKEIKDISAATTLSFSKNPKLIAQAVATTKALGMEMSKVEDIAESLLDFESSISNELQAELLLGKNINLEKARQAALNNDLATLAQEISSQIGSAAEFSEMNRIQQDALAKSVGMSREELAKTLFVQEQLKGATGEQAKEQQALLEDKIAEVGLAQAQKELAKEGVEGLRQQASMADRLNAVMEKLQEVFVSLVEPLMPVLDIFMSVANVVGHIMKFLGPILKITTSIGSLGLLDVASGKGLFAGVSEGFSDIGGAIDSYMDDGVIPAGYGDTIVRKGKGTIALNNNDTVVAGTNLGQGSKAQERTNMLLEKLITQNSSKPQLSPVGLYEVQ
jgi:hypothetical protein